VLVSGPYTHLTSNYLASYYTTTYLALTCLPYPGKGALLYHLLILPQLGNVSENEAHTSRFDPVREYLHLGRPDPKGTSRVDRLAPDTPAYY
jgi:hypothetical protein